MYNVPRFGAPVSGVLYFYEVSQAVYQELDRWKCLPVGSLGLGCGRVSRGGRGTKQEMGCDDDDVGES